MSDKIKIEIRPYDAFAILFFCEQMISLALPNDERMTAIKEAVSSYKEGIVSSATVKQIREAIFECKVNYAAGRQPPKNEDNNV